MATAAHGADPEAQATVPSGLWRALVALHAHTRTGNRLATPMTKEVFIQSWRYAQEGVMAALRTAITPSCAHSSCSQWCISSISPRTSVSSTATSRIQPNAPPKPTTWPRPVGGRPPIQPYTPTGAASVVLSLSRYLQHSPLIAR